MRNSKLNLLLESKEKSSPLKVKLDVQNEGGLFLCQGKSKFPFYSTLPFEKAMVSWNRICKTDRKIAPSIFPLFVKKSTQL